MSILKLSSVNTNNDVYVRIKSLQGGGGVRFDHLCRGGVMSDDWGHAIGTRTGVFA